MTWLTSAELAAMRTDIANLLPDTCNLLSLTLTSDGQGGHTEAWGTATASVSCRLDAAGRPFEGQAGTRQEEFGPWVLSVPQGTSITAQQRVECNGSTFNVTSVDNEKSWVAVIRAQLELV